jgi:hypothetical protein
MRASAPLSKLRLAKPVADKNVLPWDETGITDLACMSFPPDHDLAFQHV